MWEDAITEQLDDNHYSPGYYQIFSTILLLPINPSPLNFLFLKRIPILQVFSYISLPFLSYQSSSIPQSPSYPSSFFLYITSLPIDQSLSYP